MGRRPPTVLDGVESYCRRGPGVNSRLSLPAGLYADFMLNFKEAALAVRNDPASVAGPARAERSCGPPRTR
jgi:hypothetical protein